uniref:Uncharacterized protein n=1 Tax=Aegilops tauschii subsp. strangulata TaxID=200361 RepID=A0A453M629_AEGTS
VAAACHVIGIRDPAVHLLCMCVWWRCGEPGRIKIGIPHWPASYRHITLSTPPTPSTQAPVPLSSAISPTHHPPDTTPSPARACGLRSSPHLLSRAKDHRAWSATAMAMATQASAATRHLITAAWSPS